MITDTIFISTWHCGAQQRIDLEHVAQQARPTLANTTHDDGRIVRHERAADRSWSSETIYDGPQGPRGVAAGRFDLDPELETIAIFGYSGNVELLTRRPDGWEAETVFTNRHKGHWLAAAELDGRNETTELLASGYGARIVPLSRPPVTR